MDAMVTSWITPKAVKGTASEIAGRGLVAVESIEEGEVVAVKGGHIVTTGGLRRLPEQLQSSKIQIADDLHLVATTEAEYEPVMLFLNHSCEPNVGFGGNIVLVRCTASMPVRSSPPTMPFSITTRAAWRARAPDRHVVNASTDGTGSAPNCRTGTAATSRGTSTGGCNRSTP